MVLVFCGGGRGRRHRGMRAEDFSVNVDEITLSVFCFHPFSPRHVISHTYGGVYVVYGLDASCMCPYNSMSPLDGIAA